MGRAQALGGEVANFRMGVKNGECGWGGVVWGEAKRRIGGEEGVYSIHAWANS